MKHCRMFALVLAVLISPSGFVSSQERRKIDALEISELMTSWEKSVRAHINKDQKLKAIAAKHSLALLHNARYNVDGEHARSDFSFVHGSSVSAVHGNDTQVAFYGDRPRPFFALVGKNALLVRLPKSDFEKNIDPAKISIDHPDIITDAVNVADGEVYLLRVRDLDDNDFFVVIQVVTVGSYGDYVSFLWRILPGSRPIVRMKSLDPAN